MCMLCTLDPTGAVLTLPIAQATVIAAPIMLRGQIKRGAKAVRRRMTGIDLEPVEEVPVALRSGARGPMRRRPSGLRHHVRRS